MEIRNVATFLKVSELLNFTKAAEQLGYSQATVTVQIKQLEEELDTKLFERIGKQVFLSERGKEFIPYAAKLLKAAKDASSFADKPMHITGNLRIGAIPSLASSILPDVFIEFHKKHPQVETILIVSDYKYDVELIDMLQRNDIDLMFYAGELINNSDYITLVEKPEPLAFVTNSSNPIAHKKKVPPEKILEEPFILTTLGVKYCNDLERMLTNQSTGLHITQASPFDLEQIIPDSSTKLHPYLQIGFPDIVNKILLKNGGVSYLPLYTVQEYLDNGQLSAIDVDCPISHVTAQLVCHKDKWVTPQMESFIETLRNIYSK